MHLLHLVFLVTCITTRLISAAPEIKPCDDETYDEITQRNVHVATDKNQIQGRILGGYIPRATNAGIMAKLDIKIKNIQTTSNCGGTLINPNYVLTVSSCFPANEMYIGEIEVTFGARDLSHNEPQRITRSGIKVKRPNFNPDSDVALVRLSQPVEFNEHITPARLPAEGNWYKKQSGVVLGWGAEGLGIPAKGELRAMIVTFLNDCECRQVYGNQYQRETMLCAGNPHEKSETCTGDQGGPLYVGEFIVGVAIHSRCDEKGYVNMYTKVSSYVRWIEKHSADEGKHSL